MNDTELPQGVPLQEQAKDPEPKKPMLSPSQIAELFDLYNKGIREAEKEKIDFILKSYEPYDLSEIEKIIQKVRRQTIKQRVDQKLDAFNIALKKITLIIKNSKDLYYVLEQEESINDPYDYSIALDAANNLKVQFELEIAELTLELGIQAEPRMEDKSEKPNITTSSLTDSSISEPSDGKPYMSVKEVAEYLNCSDSKIYHMIPKGEIPCHLIGRSPRFIRSEIDVGKRR